jgi:hypothetical protein
MFSSLQIALRRCCVRGRDTAPNLTGLNAERAHYDYENYSHHHSVLCNVLSVLGPEKNKQLAHRGMLRF